MTSQPHAQPSAEEPSPESSRGPAQEPPPGCPAHGGAGGVRGVPLMGPRFHTDIEGVYRDMRREHGPVVPVVLPGDVPAWLVIGYKEMYQVTTDPVLYPRDVGLWNQWETLPEDWPLRPMVGQRMPSVYFTVGEEHRRHLTMVQDALERVGHVELRRSTERIADALIDRFCGAGEAEVISAYAKPLTVLALARMLGFPETDDEELISSLGAMADGGADAIAGFDHAVALMGRLVAHKRTSPGADVVSYMVTHQLPFSDQEFTLDLMAITSAGYLPTADWIGNSVRLMLTDERFAASLTGGRHSVPEAMNEVLWEDTPTQILAGRWAARDTRLGGESIKAGDMLLLGLAGANADPEAHDPGASDDGLRNSNFAHFAFSHGEFQCPFPAQEIAEIIARTGIEVLLDRLPGLDLAVPADTLARRPSPFLRGMTVLPVQFAPTPAYGG